MPGKVVVVISLVLPGVVATEFASNALGGTPTATTPAGPQGAQTAQAVASAIVGLIDRPVAELCTNPSSAETARKYMQDPAAFEANMTQPHSRSA